MFGVKVEKHGANSELRQKGKACYLACGYGGSVGALKAMGADKLGMTEDEMAELVMRWRMSNPKITDFWRALEVLEVPEVVGSVEDVCAIMSKAPSWAESLPLEVDGYACGFYRKK